MDHHLGRSVALTDGRAAYRQVLASPRHRPSRQRARTRRASSCWRTSSTDSRTGRRLRLPSATAYSSAICARSGRATRSPGPRSAGSPRRSDGALDLRLRPSPPPLVAGVEVDQRPNEAPAGGTARPLRASSATGRSCGRRVGSLASPFSDQRLGRVRTASSGADRRRSVSRARAGGRPLPEGPRASTRRDQRASFSDHTASRGHIMRGGAGSVRYAARLLEVILECLVTLTGPSTPRATPRYTSSTRSRPLQDAHVHRVSDEQVVEPEVGLLRRALPLAHSHSRPGSGRPAPRAHGVRRDPARSRTGDSRPWPSARIHGQRSPASSRSAAARSTSMLGSTSARPRSPSPASVRPPARRYTLSVGVEDALPFGARFALRPRAR